MNEGFYTKTNGELIYGRRFIYAPTYKLTKNLKDTYQYPVHGWRWFDSLEDACLFFDIDVEEYKKSLEPKKQKLPEKS
jgi:hypothetical protein